MLYINWLSLGWWTFMNYGYYIAILPNNSMFVTNNRLTNLR